MAALTIVLVWLAFFGGIAALIARRRHRNPFAWFFAGCVFGMLAWLALVVMRRGTRGLKQCPECAERVLKAAHVCRYCGHHFPAIDQAPVVQIARPA